MDEGESCIWEYTKNLDSCEKLMQFEFINIESAKGESRFGIMIYMLCDCLCFLNIIFYPIVTGILQKLFMLQAFSSTP